MAYETFNRRKFGLLTSTALTKQVAALGALGVVFGAGQAFALDPNALPQDPNVVGGGATFNSSGATLTVNQSTNRTVIDWRSFNIGSNATTNFVQPGASSIAVNRVNASTNPTEIQGHLNANGQVWILNPNGVLFGKTAKIDVAGIVASTGNIDTTAFMRGDNRLQFTGGDGGKVVNDGLISVADGGLAAFVAPSVRNSGIIRARVGKVTLAAGTTFTLDLAGDQLVELGLGANNAIVDQSGQILADGSVVNITAKAASAVVDSVINISGTVLASSVSEDGGTITLSADNINTASSAVLKADAGANGDGGTIYSYADKTGNYDGTFSAKGGSASGDGGFIETSGKKVQIADGISINTLADHGDAGMWTIDPDDLTVIDGGDTGSINPADSTVTNATIVNQLNTTGVTLAANNSISVNAAIDSSGQSSSTTLALNDQDGGGLTVNLNDKIILGANQHLTGQGTVVNVSNNGLIQNGVDVATTGGATVNVAAGDYNQTVTVRKDGIALVGATGSKIIVPSVTETNAVDVWANDFSITGFEIAGPAANQSYLTYSWGSINTRGVVIHNGALNFTISDNNIHGLRNDILIDGRNTGSITNNTIDNSKSGISVQYTDAGAGNSEGYAVTIAGNSEGPFGNEWGLNTHLNGHYVGATYYNNAQKIAADATTTVQQALLANSAANGGWSVQDQGYSNSNRTRVVVSTTGSDTNQGSALGSLKTIQAGINAVVTGGTVNVNDGTYVIPAGGGAYVHITKSLNLIGQSEAGTIIDARNASSYGIRVQADDVTLSDFTLWGSSAANSYGIKVEPLAGAIIDPNNRLNDFSIANVTVKDSYKTGLDLNGVDGATIDHVTVTGATHGNGVALTDTANTTLTNVTTSGNAWGGLALYQTNNTYNQQVNNISVDASNSFGEANGIYLEDQSASKDYGLLTIAGYDYAVGNNGLSNDVYTWLQKTRQDAIDFAANVSTSTAFVQGWLGSAVNNIFTVGYNTAGTNALSINAAITAATTGATVNVLSGTYNQNVTINKSGLSLLSDAGRDVTKIVGQGSSATGTVIVANGADNVTIGSIGHGFEIVGIDNASAGLESAAVYFAGNSSGTTIAGNRITANGDYGLLTVGGKTINGLTIDSNIFDGKTFAGATAGDLGFTNQFTAANVPRQLVTINSGANVQNVSFTNNEVTGTAGGLNSSGQEQGNTLVTIDANGATITGNTFAGTTTRFGDALRARGTNTTVSGNTFDGAHMGAGTNMLELNNSALVGTFADVLNQNTWLNGSVWLDHAVSNVNYVFRGIQSAITNASAGDAVHVGAGTYNEALNITKNLDIVGAGADQTIVQPTTLLTTGANHKYDTNMKVAVFVDGASDVNLSGMTIDGNGLGANAIVFWNNASGSITDARIQNVGTFNGAQTGQGLAVDATGATTSDLTLTNVAFENWNKNAIDAVSGGGSTSGGGNINLTITDSTITGRGTTGINAQNGILLWERGGAGSTVGATVDNVAISDVNYTGNDATASGILVYGSPNGTLTVKNSSFDNIGTYIALDAGSVHDVDATDGNTFDGVAVASATLDQLFGIVDRLSDKFDDASNGLVRLVNNEIFVTANKGGVQTGVDAASSNDTVNVQAGTYAEDVNVSSARKLSFNGSTLNSYTQSVASAIGGAVTAVNGFFMNAATTLLSNTVLNGAVTAQSIDGSTAGGQALTINGGSSAVALGNLGATTRLGATDVTGTTSLNGSVYNANALTFNGPATLTQALTTFDTSAAGGNVTFTGNIFGTTDSLQSVAFTTGSGDISLQNAGTDNIWLGLMTATGDDFSAATVYVNGYVSVLTGNQTFTSTTLHSKGAVNSSVGGDASGPIISDSNVNVTTGGDFNGNVNAPSGTISGTNITGSFTGNTFTFVASNSVNLTTNANTINVTSPSGTVDGTFSTISNSGGSIVVNGQTRTDNSGTNPNQIVVEGYTLPAGAIVTSTGEIILPSGLVIGLISPQAGGGAPGSKPKVVVVHSVQKLGELLAQGYVAIIIDLSKNNDDQEELALAD